MEPCDLFGADAEFCRHPIRQTPTARKLHQDVAVRTLLVCPQDRGGASIFPDVRSYDELVFTIHFKEKEARRYRTSRMPAKHYATHIKLHVANIEIAAALTR